MTEPAPALPQIDRDLDALLTAAEDINKLLDNPAWGILMNEIEYQAIDAINDLIEIDTADPEVTKLQNKVQA